jgi:hypothetical protein
MTTNTQNRTAADRPVPNTHTTEVIHTQAVGEAGHAEVGEVTRWADGTWTWDIATVHPDGYRTTRADNYARPLRTRQGAVNALNRMRQRGWVDAYFAEPRDGAE